MKKHENKKLLVLGGKPIGSCEIVKYAQTQGAYVIVADYLPKELSAAKQIANEAIDISTADVDTLVDYVKSNNIDGVYTGVHEFNICRMIDICEQTGLPCYTTVKQWEKVDNKVSFKNMCRKYDIPVTKEYRIIDRDLTGLQDTDFPVIIKPADGSGSRGFSICNNMHELEKAFTKAVEFSPTRTVLIEQFMDYTSSVIINYTICDGEVVFSGIGDKRSKKVSESGAPIMAAVIYPSLYTNEYLIDLDEKVKRMFISEGYTDGVVWIEAFCNKGKFTINEMGYRFGGSLTYYPVEYLTGIKQMEMQVDYALGTKTSFLQKPIKLKKTGIYVVFPVHVRPGYIKRIEGIEKLEAMQEIKQIVYVHYIGDTIENWGSAQQVFAYIHYVVKDRDNISKPAKQIMKTLQVCDQNDNNLLFNLFVEM